MANAHASTIGRADKVKIALLVIMVSAVPMYMLYGFCRDWIEQRLDASRGYASTTVVGAAARLRQMQEANVAFVGQVAHVSQLPPDRFVLVRYRMTCCAADATPVTVPVRWAGATSLKDGAWVKVFGKTDPAAKAVVADKVEATGEPSNPYL